MFQYLQNGRDGKTTRKAWRTYRAAIGVDQNRRRTMIRDLQDDHHDSPGDFFPTLHVEIRDTWVLREWRKGHEGKGKERSSCLKEKGQGRWNAAGGRREEDCRTIVEGRRTHTRRSEVAAEATRERKDRKENETAAWPREVTRPRGNSCDCSLYKYRGVIL